MEGDLGEPVKDYRAAHPIEIVCEDRPCLPFTRVLGQSVMHE